MRLRPMAFPSRRKIQIAIAISFAVWMMQPLRAQELPAAPSSVTSALALAASETNSNLFGTPSLFVSGPGSVRWALFLTSLPRGGVQSPSSGMRYRLTGANLFALPNQSPITSASGFALGGGINLSAAVAHKQGSAAGAMPLSGLSLSTRASGMDFSLSGGLTSGNPFGGGGFGSAPAGDRSLTGVPSSVAPQLLLRLKF